MASNDQGRWWGAAGRPGSVAGWAGAAVLGVLASAAFAFAQHHGGGGHGLGGMHGGFHGAVLGGGFARGGPAMAPGGLGRGGWGGMVPRPSAAPLGGLGHGVRMPAIGGSGGVRMPAASGPGVVRMPAVGGLGGGPLRPVPQVLPARAAPAIASPSRVPGNAGRGASPAGNAPGSPHTVLRPSLPAPAARGPANPAVPAAARPPAPGPSGRSVGLGSGGVAG